VPGRVVPGIDPLHEGPAPAGLDGEAWLGLRAEFIASRGWASRESALARLAEFDDAVARAGAADEVVLWFEPDLHCQLMLVRLVDRLARVAPRAVSLVAPGEFLARADVRALFQRRVPLSAAAAAAARVAWKAFTSPVPPAIAAVVAHDTGALPDLSAALERHLEQFPSSGTGLARTERAILAALADGPRPRRAVSEAVQAAEGTPYMGDTIVFDYLVALEREPAPLVVEDDDGARLTAQGVEVLAGRADAIALRGIDRWLGGAHLRSPASPRRTAVWRWNTTTRTLVRE
jgi:hypothetical protein